MHHGEGTRFQCTTATIPNDAKYKERARRFATPHGGIRSGQLRSAAQKSVRSLMNGSRGPLRKATSLDCGRSIDPTWFVTLRGESFEQVRMRNTDFRRLVPEPRRHWLRHGRIWSRTAI
jgi:hypothetical protein